MSHTHKVYFENLNGLRFIAACFIILRHIQMFVPGLSPINVSLVLLTANLSLVILFVLSGFLITYLVIKENKVTGTIRIGKFYIRRILRIWPVYYVVVILNFFVLPHFMNVPGVTDSCTGNHSTILILCLLFLPGLAKKKCDQLYGIGPAWTLNIEEPFYLLWPWFIRRIKRPARAICIIIAVLLVSKIAVIITSLFVHKQLFIFRAFLNNRTESYLTCLLIGALGGAVLAENKKMAAVLFARKSQVLVYIIFAVAYALNGVYYCLYGHQSFYEFFAILFTIMIINLAANKDTIVKMEYPVLNYLGKTSYGLYMYHVTMMIIVTGLFHVSGWLFQVLIYIATFAGSILSYELIEKRFLHAKAKFSVIVSGDEAEEDKQHTIDNKRTSA